MTLDRGPRTPDHFYVPTMGARCGADRCGMLQTEHPIALTTPDPMTGCSYDHRTIDARMLIGDGGWVRSRCPGCHVMIEPIMADGQAHGPTYGVGRGELTPRLKMRLRSWLGWLAFNGGDGPSTLDT